MNNAKKASPNRLKKLRTLVRSHLFTSTLLTPKELAVWRIAASFIVTIGSVIVPFALLPWEGQYVNTLQVIPPIFSISNWTSILASTYFWIASARSLAHLRATKLSFTFQYSSDYLDTVHCYLFQLTCCWTFVSTVLYWSILFHTTGIPMSLSDALQNSIVLLFVAIDYFLSFVYFHNNHLLPILFAPSLWIYVQIIWVFSGNRNSYTWLTFQDEISVSACAVFIFLFTLFFFLLKIGSETRNRLLVGDNEYSVQMQKKTAAYHIQKSTTAIQNSVATTATHTSSEGLMFTQSSGSQLHQYRLESGSGRITNFSNSFEESVFSSIRSGSISNCSDIISERDTKITDVNCELDNEIFPDNFAVL